MLSTKGRYAVIAVLDIAINEHNGLVNLHQIAKRQGISLRYLEQIFSKLKQANIVSSEKGPRGGYKLMAEKNLISIKAIIDAVGEKTDMTRCGNNPEKWCLSGKKCITHELWEGLNEQIDKYLGGLFLHDVINHNILVINKVNKL